MPGSEIVGPTELRKRKHENNTRAFFFRVLPTIWEPGTGYEKATPEVTANDRKYLRGLFW